jgi:hypothetical protein
MAAESNVHVWGSESPHQVIDHEQDSPEINVFYVSSERKVYIKTNTVNIYLCMLVK